jgi:hypothetical protein
MVLPDRRDSRWIHAAIVLALTALFVGLFLRYFVTPLYIAESDLYEDGLPIFLSPIWVWSSYEFSGLPAFADPADFTFYPLRILFGTLLHSWTALVMTGPLVAALFTYAYMHAQTRSKTAAVYAALAYGLSEEMLERLRHFNHVHVIAWLPLIALALDRVDGRPGRGRWMAVGAIAVGSTILAGHPQPAIYALYALGLYALAGLAFDGGGWRRLVQWTTMAAIGCLLAAVKGLPLAEASGYVVRSEGLTFERFVGPALSAPQLLTFLFPAVLHEPVTELPTYVGLGSLLLAGLALSRWRSNWRIPYWTIMALVGVGMALGTATPLPDLAYHIPLYSWFRNLARHLFLFAFGASVLAGFGVAALQRAEVRWRPWAISAGLLLAALVGGAVLLAVLPAWFPQEPHGAQPGPGPLAALSVRTWLQLAFGLTAIGLTARLVRRSSQLVCVLLLAVLVTDLLTALPYPVTTLGIEYAAVSERNLHPSVHAEAIARLLEPTQTRALAVGGTQIDEVLPATFARVWRIPIAGGYGAMLSARTSRLANMGTNGEVRPDVLMFRDRSLDLLAVRYIIVNDALFEDPLLRDAVRGDPDRWREVMHVATARDTDRGQDETVEGETPVTVFENRRAMPRAWIVSELVPVPERVAITSVRQSLLPDGRPFDPTQQALVDPSALTQARVYQPGATDVRVRSIGDGSIRLAVSSEKPGFLVLSENAYPGWIARVDGHPVAPLTVNVSMQGIEVPAGTHQVEFSMEPRSLRIGLWLSGGALAACLALVLVGRPRQAP